MKRYRRERVGGGVWKARDALLVAIGPNEGSDKVVRAARAARRRVRRSPGTPCTSRRRRSSSCRRARRRAILAVLKLAQDLGAQTATVSGTDAVDVARRLRAHAQPRPDHARPRARAGRRWRVRFRRDPAARLGDLAPDIDVVVVSRAAPASPGRDRRRRASAQRALAALRHRARDLRGDGGRRARGVRVPGPREHGDALPARGGRDGGDAGPRPGHRRRRSSTCSRSTCCSCRRASRSRSATCATCSRSP